MISVDYSRQVITQEEDIYFVNASQLRRTTNVQKRKGSERTKAHQNVETEPGWGCAQTSGIPRVGGPTRKNRSTVGMGITRDVSNRRRSLWSAHEADDSCNIRSSTTYKVPEEVHAEIPAIWEISETMKSSCHRVSDRFGIHATAATECSGGFRTSFDGHDLFRGDADFETTWENAVIHPPWGIVPNLAVESQGLCFAGTWADLLEDAFVVRQVSVKDVAAMRRPTTRHAYYDSHDSGSTTSLRQRTGSDEQHRRPTPDSGEESIESSGSSASCRSVDTPEPEGERSLLSPQIQLATSWSSVLPNVQGVERPPSYGIQAETEGDRIPRERRASGSCGSAEDTSDDVGHSRPSVPERKASNKSSPISNILKRAGAIVRKMPQATRPLRKRAGSEWME